MSTTPESPQAPALSERERFEAWYGLFAPVPDVPELVQKHIAWFAWRTRAALATPEARTLPADLQTMQLAHQEDRALIDRLSHEIERLQSEARTQAPGGDARDAARYRWLRDFSQPAICAFYLSVGKAFDGVRFTRETVDAAIDEQIASAPSSPPLSGWTNGPGRNGGPGGCDPGVTP